MDDEKLFTEVFQEQNIFIKFESEKHEVDADIICKTILGFNMAIKGLAVKSHAEAICVKVKVFEPGSIDIPIVISSIISIPDTMTFLMNICENIKNLYTLYLFLNGEPAKKIENMQNNQIKIENNIGEKAIFNSCVFNVYKDLPTSPLGDIDKMISNEDINGISFSNEKKEPFIQIAKKDFPKCIPHKKSVLIQGDVIEEVEAELCLSELNLRDPEKNWGFIYNETPIKAKILDNIFQRKINAGQAFRKGDKLKVYLRKNKKYDITYGQYLIKKYEIIEVLEYYPMGKIEQASFFN